LQGESREWWWGTNNERDPINELYNRIPEESGMQRVDTMVELSHMEYSRENYAECLALCEAAKELIDVNENSANKLSLAHINMGIGWSLGQMERYEAAAEASKAAGDLYLELGDFQYAKSMNTAGDFYLYARQWHVALDCYQSILREAVADTEPLDIAIALSNSALALAKLKRYQESISTFKEARAHYKKLRDVENVGFCDSEIARCYAELGEGLYAEAFASSALDIAETMDKLSRLIWAKYRLARAFQVQGRHEEAIAKFAEAIRDMNLSPNPWIDKVIFAEMYVARSLRALKRYEEATEIERRLRNVAEIALDEHQLNDWLELLPQGTFLNF